MKTIIETGIKSKAGNAIVFGTKGKKRNELTPQLKFLNTVLALALFVSMIVPMLNVLAVSFSTNTGSMQPGIALWPQQFSVEGYIEVWQRVKLWQPFLNSLFVTVTGTLIQVVLSSLAGYVLIQKDLPLRNLMTAAILITMMIPGELTLISIYSLNKSLGLLNSYTGLIANGLISGFSILLMRNYFLSVPPSLAESARIDRASELKIFWKIYLPLSVPGLATVTFLGFVGKWNSLMIPVTIISDQKLYTLPLILKTMILDTSSTSGTDILAPNAIMATIVISVVPIVLLYAICQRFLISGMTVGASKG